MKIILILTAIIFVLLPVSSMAGRGGGGFSYEEGLFWVADRDRNQRLDIDEAKSVYNLANAEIFARFDENSNGLINRLEFREFLQLSPWVEPIKHSKDK